jgi:hypothetical protein
MSSIVLPVVAAFLVAMVSSAHAIPRTFVASGGAGVACTRAAPCATFQLAHNATDANGEINCIDAGDFGSVTISKSITIDCAGTLGAITAPPTASGVLIDTAGIVVRLRNLSITASVDFDNGAALFVERCTIKASEGIEAVPPTGVTARLFVSDSALSIGGNAISVRGLGTGSLRTTLDGVRIEGSGGAGVVANGQAGTGPILVHVRNSVLAKNGSGIVATTTAAGQSVVSVTIDRTSATLANFGMVAQGPSSFVLLGRSTAMSNTTGLSATNGGTIFSYRNNHLSGNVTDGAPNAALSLK